jgi:hypothetical protein
MGEAVDGRCAWTDSARRASANATRLLAVDRALTRTCRQAMLSTCVGDPARKHGVDDPDISHATRNAMRRVAVDDDLVMLIGPARDGRLLEIGVLDIDGDDPVAIHAQPLRAKFHRFL